MPDVMEGYEMERSLAFTALLSVSPEGFGKLSADHAASVIIDFLADFHQLGWSDSRN